jgi:predicted esterase
MVTISVAADLAPHPHPNLRLLCLHGHGGTPERLCGSLEVFFQSILNGARAGTGATGLADAIGDGDALPLAVECRCVSGPLAEASRREGGRQWWRYDEDGYGDRPVDWAEMELATTKLAEQLEMAQEAGVPFDGVLGFSQGAEMVHTLALLKHQGDPRCRLNTFPRFVVSFSGAINPGHFESVSGGGPPRDCGLESYASGPTGEFFGFLILLHFVTFLETGQKDAKRFSEDSKSLTLWYPKVWKGNHQGSALERTGVHRFPT